MSLGQVLFLHRFDILNARRVDDDNPLKRPYGMDDLKTRQDKILASMKNMVLTMRQFQKDRKGGWKIQQSLVPFQVSGRIKTFHYGSITNDCGKLIHKPMYITKFPLGGHGHEFYCTAHAVRGGQQEIRRQVPAHKGGSLSALPVLLDSLFWGRKRKFSQQMKPDMNCSTG